MKNEDKYKALTMLYQKYLNSSTGSFLPIPIAKENKMFLCVYITHDYENKKENRVFDSVYRYKTTYSLLCRFFAQKSLGQAYNKYFKLEGNRSEINTLDLEDMEKGQWNIDDIMSFALSNGSNVIFSSILSLMKHHKGTEFSLEAITEAERKTFAQLKMEYEQELIAEKMSERDKAIEEARQIPLGMDY